MEKRDLRNDDDDDTPLFASRGSRSCSVMIFSIVASLLLQGMELLKHNRSKFFGILVRRV